MEKNLATSDELSPGAWTAEDSRAASLANNTNAAAPVFGASPVSSADTSAYRWVALFIVWAAFLLSYVDRVAWSTVAAPVGATLGLKVSMLGAFVTAFYAG
ncbi:hypothetical protein [Paraburkholderia sp.]|jgi:hypothetical protein|uniref:hypothetical protein n=1 Tax=Paraburkholderia sp. TaxID=1926495 RepID=UPI002F41C9BA